MFRKASPWVLPLLFFLAFAGPYALTQQPLAPVFKDTTVLPEGQMGARIRSFIDVINSGSADRVKRFLNEECAQEFREMVPLNDHISTSPIRPAWEAISTKST